jgi:uncharacterized damage-inducible protein DinB
MSVSKPFWFDRKFVFDLPIWMAPNILERLRGTPARLEELIRGLPPNTLTARHDDAWSIQENVGHLGDLEALWLARVEDFLAGRSDLTAADLQNRKTHDADHNRASIAALLSVFRVQRGRFVHRLEGMSEGDWGRTALHPRLRTPMRLLDSAFFVAEHDDHHLATIRALMRRS